MRRSPGRAARDIIDAIVDDGGGVAARVLAGLRAP